VDAPATDPTVTTQTSHKPRTSGETTLKK